MEIRVGKVVANILEEGDRVCAHIKSGKGFEPLTLNLWAGLCERGGTFLDIGAYTGLFTVAAMKYGCDVYAFEPMFFNYERLVLNVERNADLYSGKVRTMECAVSDRCAESFITFNPKVPFTAGASLIRKKGHQQRVQLITIDSLGLEQVTAMKIDVERGEPLVLAGARATIERCRPVILIEVLDDERKALVRKALPTYRVAQAIDERNWLMTPC